MLVQYSHADKTAQWMRDIGGAGFWYLATPYSNYEHGIEQACRDACLAAAWLIRRKIGVFCPIAHTHTIAGHSGLRPREHGIWLPADEPMMRAAVGLAICRMPGWHDSRGVRYEVGVFVRANKPIVLLPWPMP